jgi:radical SAM superfamily enzyme YgiQ (UPF0313 family)
MESAGPLSVVDGIAYRSNGTILVTKPRSFIEDLDSLPLPAWDLIDVKEYARYATMSNSRKGRYVACLVTSRGCPYGCIYCHKLHGKQFRSRSPDNVFAEIRLLHDQYGVTEFQILDDIFNFDLERAEAICDLVIQSRLGLSFTFPNGVRGDRMTKELVRKLRQAGTYKINYAVETASPRLQKLIRKNLDLEKIRQAIDYTARAGILTSGFFMLGFPTETRQEILETIQFAANSHLESAMFFRVVPFPNTELRDLALQDGAQLTEGFGDPLRDCHFSGKSVATRHVTAQELTDLQSEAYWRFYRKPLRVARLFRKHPNKRVVLGNLLRLYRDSLRWHTRTSQGRYDLDQLPNF